MAHLTAKRFTHPDTLEKIDRRALLTWLAPVSGYFARRGVLLPAPESRGEINYEALAAVFLQPDEAMPPDLVESLYLIHEMADKPGYDAIMEAQAEGALVLEGLDPQRATPAAAAVRAWLENPQVLEFLHSQHQLTRLRAFEYLLTEAAPPPPFAPPTPEQVCALEARLNAWYLRRGRGGGCQVRVFPKQNECWFLVRHGAPCKREGTLTDGQPGTVFYRPQEHDLVVYDIIAGELRVNGCGRRELEEFRQAFGALLFGDADAFPGTAKYTLAPLLRDGRRCLVCADVEGIESVTLREVEIRFPGQPGHQIIHRSEDIFRLLHEGVFQWPTLEHIARVGFEVKFKGSKKIRRVTLVPSNKALYGRDEDAAIIEAWLKARGFLLESLPDEDHDAALALS